MPVFEYRCPKCRKRFCELVKKFDEETHCPDCGAKAEREWAGEMYSATGKPAKKCSGNCSTCGGCS